MDSSSASGLSSGSDGLSYLGYVDDTAVWDATSGGYLHPLTGKAVSMNDGRIDGSEFVPEWGSRRAAFTVP